MCDILWLLFFIFCIYLFIAPKGLKEIHKHDDTPSANSNKQEIMGRLKKKNHMDKHNRKDIP
jgi:hypothetical protein